MADNAFNGIFDKKPSTEQKTEPQKGQEDTSAIKEQTATEPQTTSEKQPELEEHGSYTANKPVRKRGRRRKDDTDGAAANNAGHFSCLCDKDLIAKVRAIAWQEHMTVRSVVESMFTKCVAKYEKKHGLIQIEQSHTSEELF